MKVKITKDYKIFKTLTGNRPLVTPHIKKLEKMLQEKNLSEYLPILVNEQMYVIDGQHRLQALEKAKLPVFYVIVPGLTLEDVIMLNSTSKSWSMLNYIQSQIQLGNENYEKLYEFMKAYQLPSGVAAEILSGVDHKDNTLAIKHGYFKVMDYNKAVKVGDFIAKCRKQVVTGVANDRDFIKALIKVNKLDIDRNKFIHKLSFTGMNLKRMVNRVEYLREFERIYTFRSQTEKEVRFF